MYQCNVNYVANHHVLFIWCCDIVKVKLLEKEKNLLYAHQKHPFIFSTFKLYLTFYLLAACGCSH